MANIARVNKDVADSPIQTGANKVKADFETVAVLGSVTASGNTVVTASSTVKANGRGVARQGDGTSRGPAIRSGYSKIKVGD